MGITGILILVALIVYLLLRKKPGAEKTTAPATGEVASLLETHVGFYRKLSDEQKASFCERVQDFLSRTAVTGIGTEATDTDKVLVAASAIIPIFAFPGWRYNNIDEVLLYKDSFNHDYETEGADRPILGMVGNGAMHRQMILSQQSLRAGFAGNDMHNTGIHEFVHLLDKADGAVDGIPEYLLDKPYIVPWLRQMRGQINDIRAHHSDIDIYGGTNDAEFFAVISEYFFEKPQQLRLRHPVLYELLERMFRTDEILDKK